MSKKYDLVKGFLDPATADRYFAALLQLPWQEVKWGPAGGRTLPRLVYQYDGYTGGGEGKHALDDLRCLVESNFGVSIQGIWCNKYRNGQDYTPPHQDLRDGIGAAFTISFGATRRLIFSDIRDGTKVELIPTHGDLYYFSREMDRENKHSVPKGRKCIAEENGVRISVVLFS